MPNLTTCVCSVCKIWKGVTNEVLFAVSNEEISEAIVKKYQKNYKEIISYKNVYYFNAILKEIQKDKKMAL